MGTGIPGLCGIAEDLTFIVVLFVCLFWKLPEPVLLEATIKC